MNWKGIAVLAAAFGWFGGSPALAEEAAKPAGGCRRGCQEQAPKASPAKCAECEARAASDARSAEIQALRAEIAKARKELASILKPTAPAPEATEAAAKPAATPAGAWLGLQVAEGRCGRLEITGVADGSPAATAGVQKGDTLLLWGDQGVLCVKDLEGLAAQSKAGDRVTLIVLRGHAWIKAEVTLAAEPGVAPAQPAQPAQPAEEPAQPADQPAQPEEQPPAEDPK